MRTQKEKEVYNSYITIIPISFVIIVLIISNTSVVQPYIKYNNGKKHLTESIN